MPVTGVQTCALPIFVVAHGNSLRALLKFLAHIDDDAIMGVNIPTGIPLVFEFDDDMRLVRYFYLASQEELNEKMAAVANQGKVQG